jgi:tRNA dimethylallyltransferase
LESRVIPHDCIVVLGPTASGKTRLACRIAYEMRGEIISADSRQVYRNLTIGTGKDLTEYCLNGSDIPHHLIDISEPAKQFFLHEFVEHLESAFFTVVSRGHLPVICGGTGLYLSAIEKNFELTAVKEDHFLREQLEMLTKDALVVQLEAFPSALTAHVDRSSKKRLIRGIEVATALKKSGQSITERSKKHHPYYIGLNISAELRKKRISDRLQQRLKNGLIEEAEDLVKNGLTHERLQQLGLEYKFLSYYLLGEMSRSEMQEKLQMAIIQFSKRQMTWFRKMEKEGTRINWVDPEKDPDQLISDLKKKFG